MLRLPQILVVAALVVSIGLHWALLQSAAWVGMAVAYSVEKGSLSEGLSDTFDGDHPCPLCKAVDEGKKNKEETGAKSPIKKFEVLIVRHISFISPQGDSIRYTLLDERPVLREIVPLIEPPRIRLV
jgi:hypothetical protein